MATTTKGNEMTALEKFMALPEGGPEIIPTAIEGEVIVGKLVSNRCEDCGHVASGRTMLMPFGDESDPDIEDTIEVDSRGMAVCYACFVPDISQPKYQGATEDFEVAPPNAKRVR